MQCVPLETYMAVITIQNTTAPITATIMPTVPPFDTIIVMIPTTRIVSPKNNAEVHWAGVVIGGTVIIWGAGTAHGALPQVVGFDAHCAHGNLGNPGNCALADCCLRFYCPFHAIYWHPHFYSRFHSSDFQS